MVRARAGLGLHGGLARARVTRHAPGRTARTRVAQAPAWPRLARMRRVEWARFNV